MLMLEVVVPGLPPSFILYNFVYNYSPHSGDCWVSPLQGTVYMTNFSVMCSDFQDEGDDIYFDTDNDCALDPLYVEYRVFFPQIAALDRPNCNKFTLIGFGDKSVSDPFV